MTRPKRLLDETMVIYARALELTQNRYEGGLSSRAEVVQARTQLETARAQDIGVGVERASFEHAIAVLMGHTPESLRLEESLLQTPPPVIPVGVPSQLLERRPDIAAAERRAAEPTSRSESRAPPSSPRRCSPRPADSRADRR